MRTVAGLAVGGNGDVEALKETPYPGTGRTVAEELTELVGRIGENLVLRRAARLAVERGVVASYVHNSLAPGLGKIGVLVALESEAAGEALAALGRQLAMHVAAANPQYLDHRLGAGGGARPRARRAARAGGRQRQVGGDRRAHGRGPAAQVLRRGGAARAGLRDRRRDAGCPRSSRRRRKQAGAPIRVAGFVRLALGEGVEKPPSDFAAEVGATLKN